MGKYYTTFDCSPIIKPLHWDEVKNGLNGGFPIFNALERIKSTGFDFRSLNSERYRAFAPVVRTNLASLPVQSLLHALRSLIISIHYLLANHYVRCCVVTENKQNNFMNLKRTNPLLINAKILLLTLTFSGAMISCSDDDDNSPTQQTVLEIAAENPDFDVLEAAALKAGSGVTNVLDGTGPITVFAPTDAAFITHLAVANEAAAIAAVNGLTPAAAADLLTFHVIAGSEIKAADIATGTTPVTTARSANNKAFVTKSGSSVTINNASVTTADVEASNGVIHIIDAVLTPPVGDIIAVATSAANAPNFGILAAALTKADLITTLQGNGPFTVFAPTDDAFLTLLRSAAFYNNPSLTEAEAINAINGLTASSTPLSLTTLTQVLLYHVVPSAAAYSINLTNNQVLTTAKAAAPKTVTIGLGSSVTVDGSASDPSTVASANISATNGVVHVINKVLLP